MGFLHVWKFPCWLFLSCNMRLCFFIIERLLIKTGPPALIWEESWHDCFAQRNPRRHCVTHTLTSSVNLGAFLVLGYLSCLQQSTDVTSKFLSYLENSGQPRKHHPHHDSVCCLLELEKKSLVSNRQSPLISTSVTAEQMSTESKTSER